MSKQARIQNYLWPRQEYINGEVYSIAKWRKKIIKRDLKCQNCDNEIIDCYRHRKLPNEAHHIVPRHHGGKNTLANGVALCHFCHDYFDLMYFSMGLDYYQVLQKHKKEERIKQVKKLMYRNYIFHLLAIIRRGDEFEIKCRRSPID